MRYIKSVILFTATLMNFTGVDLKGQGTLTFQNLDFESAQLIPIPGDPNGAVQFSAAFPGWTGYMGGQQVNSTVPNGVPIGNNTAFISIMAPPNWAAQQGSYELGFASSASATAAVAQTGQIPIQAKSLQFLALYAPTVTWGGQVLPTIRLGDGPIYTSLFGVDISSFGGQQRELRFQAGLNITYLDAITFSTQIVPEPGVSALFSLGVLLFAFAKRRSV